MAQIQVNIPVSNPSSQGEVWHFPSSNDVPPPRPINIICNEPVTFSLLTTYASYMTLRASYCLPTQWLITQSIISLPGVCNDQLTPPSLSSFCVSITTRHGALLSRAITPPITSHCSQLYPSSYIPIAGWSMIRVSWPLIPRSQSQVGPSHQLSSTYIPSIFQLIFQLISLKLQCMADSEWGISGNSNPFGGVYYQPMDKNSLLLRSHLLEELRRDLVNLNRGRPRGTGGKFKSVSRPDAQTGPHCEPNI